MPRDVGFTVVRQENNIFLLMRTRYSCKPDRVIRCYNLTGALFIYPLEFHDLELEYTLGILTQSINALIKLQVVVGVVVFQPSNFGNISDKSANF